MSVEKQKLVKELHAPARRNFPRRRVVVHDRDDLWQADVVEMRPYARFNKGYNYILTVIDVLSKYAWALPLKSKNGSDVAAAKYFARTNDTHETCRQIKERNFTTLSCRKNCEEIQHK